jgi:beta-galactosidase
MTTLRPADFLRPELVALNRLPMRAPLAFFADANAALEGKRLRRRQSLDGEWDFALVESPEHVPSDWPTAGGIKTQPAQVPGLWTMDPAVDDWPHYTNIVMPWAGLEAPETPEQNPVGLYGRSFTVAKAWLRDDIVLHLGGFESVAAVWCNGIFVGMSKDSRLAAEFLLNDAVVAGENRLDVMVIRYSGATWIEDQDHWWHGGLHRSVFVDARPRERVDDVSIVADFDAATGAGNLQVSAHACGRAPGTVKVTLWDGARETASGRIDVPMVPDGEPLQQLVTSYSYPGRVASLELAVDDVRAWTAETPERYDVTIELLDTNGKVRTATALKIGFRRVEVRDRRFLVNGVPIVFHGVNRHDHHPELGKVQTEADLRADLETMQRHNINAVRCAHYPNDPMLLDLCDELGLWVIDEANIECHARLRSIADDPRYLPAMVDRVSRMVIRDRNHPSVIMWSLGNESGHGTSHDACAAWVRATDPSRPVHYEGAIQRRFLVEKADADLARQAPSARERAVTDVVCPMYTAVEVVEEWAEWAESTGRDDRPFLLCEFTHAMGNSNGGFDRYTEAFHRLPALAGGFIWDWKDQGLRVTDDDGREFWAYGGHFGDEPNDANFCINGIVGPDGKPHPAMAEIAWGYQPVRVTHVRGRKIRVENRRSFTDLSDLTGEWQLVIDGIPSEFGSLDVHVAPGTSKNVDVPFATKLPRQGDVQLQVFWRAADGHRVAADEIVLRSVEAVDLAVLDFPGIQTVAPVRSGQLVRVGGTSLRVGEKGPSELVVAGTPVTLGTIEPTLWRAPTDNDGVAQGWMSAVSGVRNRWLAQGLDSLTWTVASTAVLTGDDIALVMVDRTAGEAMSTTRFVLTPTAIVVDESLLLPDEWADPPRIGTRFEADASLFNFHWFGPGPHETYPDRVSSGLTRIWSSTVHQEHHDYVVPQEHGAHEATRWFELAAGGHGLRFDMANPLSVSARFAHDAALTRATTTAELEQADTIEVHIDAAQRGLGTGACGPDTAAEHRIDPGWHRWRFTITEVI